jgi:hypothetical protein
MEQYSEAAVSTEQSLFELQVDHEVSSHLTQTAKWAKFLAIVGFIGMGIMVIAVVLMGTLLSTLSPLKVSDIPKSNGGFMQVVLLLAIMALYFFPCLFLFNFSNKMLRAIRNNDQYSLVASFRQLKLCFKFIGILTIVFISMYVLAFLFAMIFAATR